MISGFRFKFRLFVRKVMNVIGLSICSLAGVLATAALCLVVGYIVKNGYQAVNWKLITQGPTPIGTEGGGLRNAIVGTLVLLAVASCIGVPLGVLAGIYQAEKAGKFAKTVRFLADVLNSVPSIVIGLFVYAVVVIPIARMHEGNGFSALAGGIALSIIMIPIIMTATEEILKMVPRRLYEGSLALGATRFTTMFRVIVPAAKAGLITGIMLAVARVAGETAPLLFTAFGNVTFSVRLDKPIDSLPLSIFYNATSPYDYLKSQAMAGSLILMMIIAVFRLSARLTTRKSKMA